MTEKQAIQKAREDWLARHEAPGTWRNMWKRPGRRKIIQVGEDEAYRIKRDMPGEGTWWLLRATSADAARKIIASGQIEPIVEEPFGKRPRVPRRFQTTKASLRYRATDDPPASAEQLRLFGGLKMRFPISKTRMANALMDIMTDKARTMYTGWAPGTGYREVPSAEIAAQISGMQQMARKMGFACDCFLGDKKAPGTESCLCRPMTKAEREGDYRHY